MRLDVVGDAVVVGIDIEPVDRAVAVRVDILVGLQRVGDRQGREDEPGDLVHRRHDVCAVHQEGACRCVQREGGVVVVLLRSVRVE